MPEQNVIRKLAAILYADVAGYSRLTGLDEEGTHRTVAEYLDALAASIEGHGGQVVHFAGDAVLAEFPSVVVAVKCAVAVQRDLAARSRDIADDRKVRFRIGVNLGDVIVDRDDIYGNGVNVAARLEALAEPGGICVSGAVFEQVKQEVDIGFEDMGPQKVHNMAEPVSAFRVRIDGPSSLSRRPPLPDKPSIAVLPLVNLSGDPEQEHFADGITEDLITALSRIRWFFVIARSSSFAYKSKNVDVREIARDLGVRYVVGGSVRRSGGRVRLTAQLIDGTNGNHLWAERYDRDTKDIFALQDELTETIVGAVEPKLGKAEQERARLKKPETVDVWDMYQRGMSALHQQTVNSLVTAATTFLRVTEIDPDFAAAYAGLAEVNYYELVLGFTNDPDATRRRALAAGRRAAALDPDDPGARCALGRAFTLNRMFDDAIAEFHAALVANPSCALAHYGLGAAYVFQGQPEPSLTHLDRAIRLSPQDANMGSFCVRKAQAHLYLGDYEAAVEWARRALRFPNFQWSRYAILISALGHLGRADEAAPCVAELARRIPDFSADFALAYSPWVEDRHFRHLLDGLRAAGLKV